MADKHDKWADTLSAEHSGWLTGFLADEDKIDRRMMWRLGSWGVAAVGAVVVAVLASQSQILQRRDQVAASDALARQAQQIQFVAKETQAEARRLTLAIETLNSDRDRLFTRVTSVEQGLESVTGTIKKQPAAAVVAALVPAPPTPVPALATSAFVTPAPVTPTVDAAPMPSAAAELPTMPSAPLIGPVASTAAMEPAPPKSNLIAPTLAPLPLTTSKSILELPDATASKLIPPAPTPPVADTSAAATDALTPAPVQIVAADPTAAAATTEVVATPVARTEFGVDIGGANSVDGLRAIWRGMSKSRSLNGLRPIIMVKERANGLGMQLRLVAGPLSDAAAAAKICAGLTESNRPCETSVFDGQRLAVRTETVATPAEATPPAAAKPAPRRRAAPKPQERTEQEPPKPAEEPAPPKPQSSLTSFLGIR